MDLPGHEAQLWGWPHPWCSQFVAGLENSVGVVVGTDITVDGVTYPGTHDCTLGREVRYRADWGDGTVDWSRFAQCDRWLGMAHTYDDPGTYTLTVVAEDRQGRRTRSRSYERTVLAEGIDLTLSARDFAEDGATLSWREEIYAYGNVDPGMVEVAYVADMCDGQVELARDRIGLAPNEELERIRSIEIPPGTGRLIIQIDPDGEVEEMCPDVAWNNYSTRTVEGCYGDLPDG